jgi:signal recognition particle receptor subunit beta
MVQINFALREVNCKIVYYGCGLSGKTTNLEVVHSKAPKDHVGELTSIATEGDRTLFFDFLPLDLGHVAGMNTKFQIYTVPGQVYYNSTRKLVLQGADGIVFVADSRRGKMDENIESLLNLEENLREYGMDMNTMPVVLQYNKRDLKDIYSIEEMNEKLNRFNAPYFEAVAVTGEGVFPTLKKVSSMVLESLNRQQGSTAVRAPKKAAAKQPVAVGAMGGELEPAAAASSASSSGPSGPSRGAAGAGSSPAAATASGSAGGSKPAASAPRGPVVRDRVVKSPGVKPIERRRPPQAPTGAQRRPETREASSDPAPVPTSSPTATKGRTGLIVGVVVALAAAGVVAAYFAGVFN